MPNERDIFPSAWKKSGCRQATHVPKNQNIRFPHQGGRVGAMPQEQSMAATQDRRNKPKAKSAMTLHLKYAQDDSIQAVPS